MTQLKAKKLTEQNIKDIMALQKTITENLHPDEQHFICKKSEQEFMKTLKSEENYVLGVFDQDNLIAQSTLYMPKNGKEREMSEYEDQLANEDVAIYKTILVSPHYRKHGLMKKMLETFETLDEVKAKKAALIQIAVENPSSWVNALKHGMKITKVAKDPEDDAMVLYMKKAFDTKHEEKVVAGEGYALNINEQLLKHPQILFNKMTLVSENMVGGIWDKETKSIIWQQKAKQNTNQHQYTYIKEKANAR
ncbi:MAG: GNAT family N-acetyltransferase [Alphaproteobacteria bacterium]